VLAIREGEFPASADEAAGSGPGSGLRFGRLIVELGSEGVPAAVHIVERNGGQVHSTGDAEALGPHDRSEPAAKGLGFAEVGPAEPRGEERGLGCILGAGVISQDRVCVRDRRVLVPLDQFPEGFTRLGLENRASDRSVGQLTHFGLALDILIARNKEPETRPRVTQNRH
jgi:hypothetical protein